MDPVSNSEKHPEIQELSRILNLLSGHMEVPEPDLFRNPNGVYMKLCNFLRLDPNYKGKGLDAGGKGDVAVWNEFANDKVRLRKTAATIRTLLSQPPVAVDNNSDQEEVFPEGALLTRLHKLRERSQKAVQLKKQEVLEATGRLACEACGFDFSAQYGELGRGFAECHHQVPVSDLQPGQKTKLSDLVVVCSNCHRMLHRGSPMLSVQELKGRLKYGV